MSPGQIFAHRGLWRSSALKNSREALTAALRQGFGLETDIRDQCGELVISHDLPSNGALPLRELLKDYKNEGATGVLAFNIKADGLAKLLYRLVQEHEIKNYFVFDMSIPDMLQYDRLKIPFFSRRSDIESEIVALDRCVGIWLDAFESDWYDAETITGLLELNKHVAIVSPEIHGRDPFPVWELLRGIARRNPQIHCCTDRPDEFQKWMS
jgi:glycerophosphoryl diester phosphodiesterase